MNIALFISVNGLWEFRGFLYNEDPKDKAYLRDALERMEGLYGIGNIRFYDLKNDGGYLP